VASRFLEGTIVQNYYTVGKDKMKKNKKYFNLRKSSYYMALEQIIHMDSITTYFINEVLSNRNVEFA
jgi:hypothetical protein